MKAAKGITYDTEVTMPGSWSLANGYSLSFATYCMQSLTC